MIPLTQEIYEELWFGPSEPVLIYFTAPWCNPCKRINKEIVEQTASDCGLQSYICDITVNDYTAGFCGIKSIPTFMIQEPRKVFGKLTDSNNETICNWIMEISKDI
jgi:thioredoxin-like negative regulator of GroEL